MVRRSHETPRRTRLDRNEGGYGSQATLCDILLERILVKCSKTILRLLALGLNRLVTEGINEYQSAAYRGPEPRGSKITCTVGHSWRPPKPRLRMIAVLPNWLSRSLHRRIDELPMLKPRLQAAAHACDLRRVNAAITRFPLGYLGLEPRCYGSCQGLRPRPVTNSTLEARPRSDSGYQINLGMKQFL